MNIKSNSGSIKKALKERTILATKLYLIAPISMFLIVIVAWFVDASWGFHLAFLIIGLIAHLSYVLINENSRITNLKWNDMDYHWDWFSLVIIPLFMVWSMYFLAIKPMINDYRTEARIDKVLPMDVNSTLNYNDYNYIFILTVDGKAQPLVIDLGGNSDAYYKAKASYLDGKLKVVKKETKGWTDDESEITYQLDNHNFR